MALVCVLVNGMELYIPLPCSTVRLNSIQVHAPNRNLICRELHNIACDFSGFDIGKCLHLFGCHNSYYKPCCCILFTL